MATKAQIEYITYHKHKIQSPILIVGAKMYDYDQESIRLHLHKWGFEDIIGVDIEVGKEVDMVQDVTDFSVDFINKYHQHFHTIFCMEVLTNVNNPFKAAENLDRVLNKGGYLFLSEPFVRKLSRMPVDYWRFTFDGIKALFAKYVFQDSDMKISLMRAKSVELMPLPKNMPEILQQKHEDETILGFWIRKIHRKLFSKRIFSLSRYLPETTVYVVCKKEDKKFA